MDFNNHKLVFRFARLHLILYEWLNKK